MRTTLVTEADLPDLLPLMRGYCDFYGVAPSDEQLLALARALLADPDCEGFQLLARDDGGRPLGFATVYWTWSTLGAARQAIMNDLFVHQDARGSGLAEALIEECRVRAGRRGAVSLVWQTAKDNLRAQAVYERVGARRSEWVDYALTTSAAPASPASPGSPIAPASPASPGSPIAPASPASPASPAAPNAPATPDSRDTPATPDRDTPASPATPPAGDTPEAPDRSAGP